MSEKRKCLACDNELFGRIDKKFCSDYCRTHHYNKNNLSNRSYMREVNSILKKNLKILEGLNPQGKTTVSEKKLLENGFRLNYFTNLYTTKKGITYFFCYDQGFIKLANGSYTIFKKTDFE